MSDIQKHKVYNIMQYVSHPKTGEGLMNEGMVIAGLGHKTIKDWAYILHDEDIGESGALKPPHYHIVVRLKKAIEVETIAKWFGIPANFVEIPNGCGAFLDCVQYLTHERHADKHFYPDERVKANFDFRAALIARDRRQLKGSKDMSARDKMRLDVLHGKSLQECKAEDELQYANDLRTLKTLRMEYLNSQRPPTVRMNYYVYGNGGIGKGLMSRALARSMFPDLKYDNEIFFEVGAKNASFEEYDGQPVIIWHDRRAVDLLTELGGRGNVFNVFDTHPTSQRQNVKYSSVSLCNSVNIVNSVQPFDEFLDGLAGDYTDKQGEEHKAEDKGQSYRRFPFIIPIRENDFDLYINKGFMEGTREFEQYIQHKNIIGNLQRINQLCEGREQLARELEARAVRHVIECHNEVLAKQSGNGLTNDAIRALFADVGRMAPLPPRTESSAPDPSLPF